MPYRFPAGESVDEVVGRFRLAQNRGAIVGPHGSGKTTLLATLLPALELQGITVSACALHDGQRRLPKGFPVRPPAPGTVVVVDGYEQLGLLSRCQLRWLCRRWQLGLLVTSHGPVGLPVLFRTQVDLLLAQRIASDLQKGFHTRVHDDDVVRIFPSCEGNLRELLFKLFDLYEAARRNGQ